ncbi:MAG: lytic transglycosylase domain-containing protein [Proteobacteria bacterium]|nr:lytic transglycosylase domain-containing protein [Pseudomonadota bacterium]
MRNVIIIYGILFIFLPALRAGTATYYNPINNALIKAIIKVESSGNPKAISREGAWGLMQVRHAVWEKELKKAGIIRHKQELFNPEKNILAGKYILTKYYGQTGCLKKTLKKYSGNEKRYFEKVMTVYQGQMDVSRWFPFYWHTPLFLLLNSTQPTANKEVFHGNFTSDTDY